MALIYFLALIYFFNAKLNQSLIMMDGTRGGKAVFKIKPSSFIIGAIMLILKSLLFMSSQAN